MAGLIVVDASVLIAWLDETDAHHHDAIDVLAAVDQFVVHPLTLAEVLVHPTRQGRDGDVLGRLEAIGMVQSNQPIDAASLARLRATTGLKMPDCVVLACARDHRVEVRTFDAALARAAATPEP